MTDELERERLRQMRTEIRSLIRRDVEKVGKNLDATYRNLFGWWESPDGQVVDATHPAATQWQSGVWSGMASKPLQDCWEQLWAEDKDWLVR